MSNSDSVEIQVAGDICMDVVGVPVPPPTAEVRLPNNWQLTGETRTHFLPGGAMLLADWIRAAAPKAKVYSTQPCLPDVLAGGKSVDQPLTKNEFLDIAERLTRDEIVHSLLALNYYPETPGAKTSDVIRVDHPHGYSGPAKGEPSLRLSPPQSTDREPDIIVLDDTGNRFRRTRSQWPVGLTKDQGNLHALVVYKLHRPLPPDAKDLDEPSLWDTAKQRYPDQRVVVVSISDLRENDALISRGLSWERTALDVVWQLMNVDAFAELRECPHLIVRMGLDGAVYWQRNLKWNGDDHKEPRFRAWLIYDPTGIEGTCEEAFEGKMVGYGSVFTAALVKELVGFSASKSRSPRERASALSQTILRGTEAGLMASRRLLRYGFGTRGAAQLSYPGAELFSEPYGADFACHPIPSIPHSVVPDRGYWRLLDSIFESKTALLHRAVALTAANSKPLSDEDKEASRLLKQVPIAVFAKALRTYDRREIENYRALYDLLHNYIRQTVPPRPLSVAVFGPPGAGKSFGVKMVAKALGEQGGSRSIETLTFNLSQYHSPEQLADAFHLVRDLVLRGKIPLVFFDEFDTALAGTKLGWLRYFLAPMQDGEFLDQDTPHPIGQAIFVFAGGTSSTYADFASPFIDESVDGEAFKSAKGPDFLSRLRGTLDIPGLDIDSTFDPYGPVDSFPCEAAILLRRAGILAFQLRQKVPRLREISAPVLRALLHLPHFEHGNRSFEALLDMSRLLDAEKKFTPSMLAASSHVGLHADPQHLSELLGTDYPFPPDAREKIAKSIHKDYVKQRKDDPAHNPDDVSLKSWGKLPVESKESNYEQADHIAMKLRAAGLWFRRQIPGAEPVPNLDQRLEQHVERLAQSEHDRWVAEKRRQGWIAAPSQDRRSRNDVLRLHNFLFRWEDLSEQTKELDRMTARNLPKHLATAGYEIVEL